MNYHTINKYINILNNNELLLDSNITNMNEEVLQLTYNSKDVIKNTLFICKGVAFKKEYLLEAIKLGAIAYVSEIDYNVDIACIKVSNIRKSMPHLAKLFYNDSDTKLNLIGVGGTKGKSTTTYYIKAILDDYLNSINKKECGVISSIDVYDGVINKESHITTPESVELFMHFNNAINSNLEYLCMEVSSQALKYDRMNNIMLDIGIFLNISEDHISPIEHSDYNDYLMSKCKIFDYCKNAIINVNSDDYDTILEASKKCSNVITFAIDNEADYIGYNINKNSEGISFNVKSKDIDESFILTMPGLFNVENAIAAIITCIQLNIPMEYIKSGIYKARSKGRMELFKSNDNNVICVVDYAHNKLSFDKLFESISIEYPEYDIISIFGCPGNKAINRRKELGTIAAKYSKKVYITAEDPGYEPVIDISNEIAQYIELQQCDYEIIEDRGEAINTAINNITNKSILLITGKGRETRQKYGSEYIDCLSDVDYVLKYLEEYNK